MKSKFCDNFTIKDDIFENNFETNKGQTIESFKNK